MDIYSRSYADGSKNRVALLAADKEINKEAVDVLLATPMRCGGSESFKTFERMADDTARPRAPPAFRRKLRFDVITAPWALGQCA